MIDYYEILQVEQDASGVKIKHSFRRLAKLYHPDKNRRRETWAEARMKVLLEAYSVLRDERLRGEYDEMLRRSPEAAGKRFWQKWESKRRADQSPGSAAKLLLRFLLTDRAVEAVKIYEELREREGRVDLREWFERRDYMDCMFLLAEEYERAGRLEAAVEHYRAVHRGVSTGGDGYLGEEVRLRMRNLLLKSLPRKARGAEARKWYERAIQMGLSRSDRAFAYKKMAECSARMGMEEEGREMLRRAFELKPNLKGAKRICRILGFEAGMVQGAFTVGKCR